MSKRKTATIEKSKMKKLSELFDFLEGGLSNLGDSLESMRAAEDSEELEDAAMDALMEAEGLLGDVKKIVSMASERR